MKNSVKGIAIISVFTLLFFIWKENRGMRHVEKVLLNREFLSNDFINSLDRNANYSFLERYVRHFDPEVRSHTLALTRLLMPSNALQLFLIGIEDEEYQCINISAWSIYLLNPKDNVDDILRALRNLFPRYRSEISSSFRNLTLTIGNIGTLDDLKEFAPHLIALNREEINEALLWAMAKQNHAASREKIRFTLKTGELREKNRALDAVQYIRDPEFITDVIPLLHDDSFLRWEGPFRVKLSDRAITTLLMIDESNNTMRYADADYPPNSHIIIQEFYLDYMMQEEKN